MCYCCVALISLSIIHYAPVRTAARTAAIHVYSCTVSRSIYQFTNHQPPIILVWHYHHESLTGQAPWLIYDSNTPTIIDYQYHEQSRISNQPACVSPTHQAPSSSAINHMIPTNYIASFVRTFFFRKTMQNTDHQT